MLTMRFTDSLWQSIAGIYARILEHPFLQGLTDGSLAEEAFRGYVVQDALYLRDFARGLAVLAARAPEDEWLILFAEHAREMIVVERALHDSFFRDWGLSAEQVYATPAAPNNLLYTSYLLRLAYDRPFHEALGAFLPCYWIYGEVGLELEKRGSPVEIFRRWIATYAGEEYGAVVRQVREVMDRLAGGLGEPERERVRQHFVTSTRLEYLFWDMAYYRQGWGV
jgi:thiaminase/transcriptional activator TenA